MAVGDNATLPYKTLEDLVRALEYKDESALDQLLEVLKALLKATHDA